VKKARRCLAFAFAVGVAWARDNSPIIVDLRWTMEQVLLVMTNVPDAATADAISRYLVEHKLAACVNCLPGVKSIYQWQGLVEEADEISLMIKTTRACYSELEAAIKSRHPYQVPEIVALPIALGWPPYLEWIVRVTKKDTHV
jgi:periplasmic divalent cation tolerance protein